jgi:outer membrane protein assembly factor BamD (BamD/ComL family)
LEGEALASQRRTASLRFACLGALALAFGGCVTDTTGILSRWRMAHDATIARSPDNDDRGMMARWLNPKGPKPSDPNGPSPLVVGKAGLKGMKVAPNPEADAEFRAAETLFQQGKLEEAEKAFGKIAKKRKDTPWGEKSQYYLAETQYQRGRYTLAHDSFERLHADYPGTDYREKLVAREFEIAQYWLSRSDPSRKAPKDAKWTDHFNARVPLLDTGGNAIAALEHVRHNDPSGPLADDAAMQIADFHFVMGDYDSAALYYDQILTSHNHSKSPHLQRAQLASIDAKMKGYLGPEYDGTGLEQARVTVKETMTMFPERQASVDGALYHTLDLISDHQAERAYTRGLYYRRTGHISSAEYYFAMVPYKWPRSSWAPKAKKQLAELAKMPRTEAKPSKILTPPGSGDPFGGAFGGGMNGMGGMGMGGMGMMGGGMGMMGGMGGMGMPGGMY